MKYMLLLITLLAFPARAEILSGGITYNIPTSIDPSQSLVVNAHYRGAFLSVGYNPGAGTELIGQYVGDLETIGPCYIGGEGRRTDSASRVC